MKPLAKNIIVYGLLALLAVQVNHLLIYYTLFKLNQENLAVEVCEQKTEECNACCYLNKKMAEDTEKADPIDKKVSQQDLKLLQYTVNIFHNESSDFNSRLKYGDLSSETNPGFLEMPYHPPKI